MISTDAVECYGDGIYWHGLAYFPDLERLVRVTVLEIMKRRRDGEARPTTDPTTRLFWLYFLRWWRAHLADRDRQREVAGLLGVEWPPTGALGWRPWRWPHESQPIPTEPLPVSYPSDWDPVTHPDVHGFGDRWTPGETLVIPVDEIALEVEVLEPEPPRARPRRSRTRALPDGIPDAEVVEPTPRRRSTPSLGRGVQIGTWSETDGFVPSSGGFGLFG